MTMPAWMTKEGVAAQPAPVAPPALGGLNGRRASRHGALAFCGGGILCGAESSIFSPLSLSLTVRAEFAAGGEPRVLLSTALPLLSLSPGSLFISRCRMILGAPICVGAIARAPPFWRPPYILVLEYETPDIKRKATFSKVSPSVSVYPQYVLCSGDRSICLYSRSADINH